MTDKIKQALEACSALINYQFTGSSESMNALQHADNLVQEALASLQAQESGEQDVWQVDDWPNGRIAIQSHYCEYDTALEITGNFGDQSEKQAKAESIAAILNAAPDAPKEAEAGTVKHPLDDYLEGATKRLFGHREEPAPLNAPTQEPVAWVRFCSDGCYEGPIMDCDKRMDGRRESGAWTPLFTAPPAQQSARDDVLEQAIRNVVSDEFAFEGEEVDFAVHAIMEAIRALKSHPHQPPVQGVTDE